MVEREKRKRRINTLRVSIGKIQEKEDRGVKRVKKETIL